MRSYRNESFFYHTNPYILNVTQQCRCSPMLIFRAWATCGSTTSSFSSQTLRLSRPAALLPAGAPPNKNNVFFLSLAVEERDGDGISSRCPKSPEVALVDFWVVSVGTGAQYTSSRSNKLLRSQCIICPKLFPNGEITEIGSKGN